MDMLRNGPAKNLLNRGIIHRVCVLNVFRIFNLLIKLCGHRPISLPLLI